MGYETTRGKVTEVTPEHVVVTPLEGKRKDEAVSLPVRGHLVPEQFVIIQIHPAGNARWLT